MQKHIIIGNLVKDAEVKVLENNKKVVNFTVAVNESYTNQQGEKVESTEYFDLENWVKPESTVDQYLTKGQEVAVDYSQKTKSWEKDGEKKYRTVGVVNEMTLLRTPAKK